MGLVVGLPFKYRRNNRLHIFDMHITGLNGQPRLSRARPPTAHSLLLITRFSSQLTKKLTVAPIMARIRVRQTSSTDRRGSRLNRVPPKTLIRVSFNNRM